MKPRVTLAQFRAMQQQGSIANLIARYMNEFPSIGIDSGYRLKKLQRHPIGAMMATAFTRSDVIEYCRERRKAVCAATVTHDMVMLNNVFKYAGSGVWKDCWDVSNAEIQAARPFLFKHNFVGKSHPRDRRPSIEEVATLESYFAKQNENGRTVVDMVLLTRWQIVSSRRIGESCKLLWEDWRRDDQTILVRKMKDPKIKHKQKVVALTPEAQAMLIEIEPLRDPNEPRIFPFNSKTASARYTMAKIALGIKDLRLHDSRRECISAMSEIGYTSDQIRMVTGHETNNILDRTYNKPNPAKFKNIVPTVSK